MQGFPFSCPVEVRFVDVDAMNHVNNAVYVTYLELARLRLWQSRFSFSGSARDIPIIVARVAIDYRSPISLEEPVEVGVGVTGIGRSSFTFAYRVEAAGRLAAEAETVQVCYDYAAARPVPVDDELRRLLEAVALRPRSASRAAARGDR
ncbi:MAG TPA: thioesterase family protein [Thermoanaerobaculaceae bacterium]|nr:thioesterase family protein [Thermoanaerobaculaceae bacterium]